MEKKRVVIIGSSFAGYTAAIELRNRLVNDHEIVVISDREQFVFIPSLIWLPFGRRTAKEITFELKPVYARAGIEFVHGRATHIDLAKHKVMVGESSFDYDFLLVATGPKPDFAMLPGLGPETGYTQSICNLEHAEQTALAWRSLMEKPGPIVIGATQGASCFGAAYEFLFNAAHQVRTAGLEKECPITFVTAEPYLGHFGIGGFGKARQMTEHFFEKLGIEGISNAEIDRIDSENVILRNGRRLPFRFAMLIPRFLGVDVVREADGLANPAGFVEVDDTYAVPAHPEVYCAGVAVAVRSPEKTPVPIGVPKTGYTSEEMARVAAHNIAAKIEGGEQIHLPFDAIDAKCILDAGDTGIIMLSDHILAPRKHEWLIPGPEAHWAKIAFEKYFLLTRKHAIA